MTLPAVVDAATWAHERENLLAVEKELTRARDAVAARRRRLPMTPFRRADHRFATTDGPRSLLDLFGKHRLLAVYQFMDHHEDRFCGGCTWFTDNVPGSAPRLLAENGIAWAHVSDMPLERLRGYWAARGWTMPFASSRGTTFSAESGAGTGSWLSVFLRDGDQVFQTYGTAARGLESLTFTTSLLDLTPYGRGEEWEDSPTGWPQVPTVPVPPMVTPADTPVSFGRFRAASTAT